MKKILKQISIGLAVIFVVLISILAIVLIGLQTGPGKRWVKNIACENLEKALAQKVAIGNFKTNYVSFLELEQIAVFKEENGQKNYLLQLETGKIQFQLLPILHGKIVINKIDLDSLLISVKKDSLGNFNFPVADSSSTPDENPEKQPGTVEIGQVVIRNSALQFQDVQIPLNANLLQFGAKLQNTGEPTYRFSVASDSFSVRYQDWQLAGNPLKINGLWSPENLIIDSLLLQSRSVKLTGQADLVSENSTFQGHLFLETHLEHLPEINPELIPTDLQPLNGILNAEIEISGTLANPNLYLELKSPKIHFAGVDFQNLLIKSNWSENTLRIQTSQFGIFQGNVFLTGQVKLDSLIEHNFTCKVNGVNFRRVWQRIYHQPSPFRGILNSEIYVSGRSFSLDGLEMEMLNRISNFYYLQKNLDDFVANLKYKKRHARFSLKYCHSDAQITAQINDHTLKSKFNLNIQELGPLAGLANIPEVSGKASIKGVASGTLESPEIQAVLTGRQISYQNFPLDSLYARLDFKNQQLFVHQLNFRGRRVKLDSTNVPFHVEGLQGGFDYAGEAEGNPDSLKANVNLKFSKPGFQDFLLDSAFVRLNFQAPEIHLKELQIKKDSLAMYSKGVFNINTLAGQFHFLFPDFKNKENIPDIFTNSDFSANGQMQLDLDLADSLNSAILLHGKNLAISPLRQAFFDSIPVNGTINFDFNLTGKLTQPDIFCRASVIQPGFEKLTLDSLQTLIEYSNGEILLNDFKLYTGEHISWAQGNCILLPDSSGALQLAPQSPISLLLNGQEFDLGLLKPLLPPDLILSGMGAYSIALLGTLGKPQINGKLMIRNGRVVFNPEAPPLDSLFLEATLLDSMLTVERFTGALNTVPLKMQGKIISHDFKKYNLRADLNFSKFGQMLAEGTVSEDSVNLKARMEKLKLSVFQSFVTELKQLAGECNLDLFVNGPTGNPAAYGNLQITDFSGTIADLNAKLSKGNVYLRFDQQNVKLDSLAFNLNQGHGYLAGSMQCDNQQIKDINLTGKLSNIEIEQPEKLKLKLNSAGFSYKKLNNYFQLDGDIILGESKFIYQVKPQDFLSFAQSVERPKSETPQIIQQTRLNIRLRESEKLWIDNNLAHLRMHSELALIGNAVQPNLTGRLSFEEGYVLYLDRKFQIKKGVIDFIDPVRFNPIVDIQAESSIKSYQSMKGQAYTITLGLSGPLDHITFNLTSEPGLEKSDIIALLTVGATRNQIIVKSDNGKSQTVGEVLKERLAVISSQRLSGYATRKVSSMLGLEEMSIEGNLFQFGKAWGPQLVASKKLSERIKFTYSTTVGHQNEESIRLDYKLTNRFSLRGQTDQRGRNSLDLKYGLKFK